MEKQEWLAQAFEAQRPHLQAVAYRLLGSLTETNDAVQEAWLRLSRSDTSNVPNLGGWLTTTVARISLNMLRSRKLRREESLEASTFEPDISSSDHGIPESTARYHFAFTIPGKSWQQAKAWLEARLSLLRRDGQDLFFIDIWNAHSLYFQDAAGNLGEFIAHHELPAEPSDSFGVQDILRLSEIGLVGEDVPAMVDQFHSQLSLDPYKGFCHPEFTAVGDICGLFIVVQTGRIWFPTVSEPAVVAPLQVTIKGTHPQHYHLTPFPYDITVVAQE